MGTESLQGGTSDRKSGSDSSSPSWRRGALKLAAFIKRDFYIEISYKFQFLFQFLSIFISVPTFFFLSKLVGNDYSREHLGIAGGDYFSFVLIGISFSNFIRIGLIGLTQAIRSAMVEGSLEAMFATPTSPTLIIMASSVWQFAFESVRIVIYLATGWLLFGAQFVHPNIAASIVVLVLTIIAFTGLGLISASVIIVLKRGDPLNWIVQALFTLLGGVLFPVSVLPDWLRTISYALPITYSLRAMREALIAGSGFHQLAPDIAALAVFSAIVFPLGIIVCRFMTTRAKIMGSLSSY